MKKVDPNLPEFNPETGEIEAAPKVLLGRDGKPLKKAYGQAGNGWAFYVHLDGHKVYLGHMKREQVNAVISADKEFAAASQQIVADQRAEKVDPVTAESRSFAAMDAREAAHRNFLDQYIKGWELPDYECTPENIHDLEFADVISITTAITQKKLAGQEAQVF